MSRLAKRPPASELSLEDEIAHLRGLDLQGLRARWKGVFRRDSPEHLPRQLLFGVLAYRLQADRLGDLDPTVRKVLDQSTNAEPSAVVAGRLSQFDVQRTTLAPGTILMRHWNGKSQRVMVMAEGFGWNGGIYDSLSKVAFAITGTRWNGPRFFGLRSKKAAAEQTRSQG
jgi:hypothetical protein